MRLESFQIHTQADENFSNCALVHLYIPPYHAFVCYAENGAKTTKNEIDDLGSFVLRVITYEVPVWLNNQVRSPW